MPTLASTRIIRLTVIAADGLIKKDLFFKMPDPFGIIINIFKCKCVYILNIFSVLAVVTVDGEQTHTTTVMKKTLNPYWNESFDLYVVALMIHFLVVY